MEKEVSTLNPPNPQPQGERLMAMPEGQTAGKLLDQSLEQGA